MQRTQVQTSKFTNQLNEFKNTLQKDTQKEIKPIAKLTSKHTTLKKSLVIDSKVLSGSTQPSDYQDLAAYKDIPLSISFCTVSNLGRRNKAINRQQKSACHAK